MWHPSSNPVFQDVPKVWKMTLIISEQDIQGNLKCSFHRGYHSVAGCLEMKNKRNATKMILTNISSCYVQLKTYNPHASYV